MTTGKESWQIGRENDRKTSKGEREKNDEREGVEREIEGEIHFRFKAKKKDN